MISLHYELAKWLGVTRIRVGFVTQQIFSLVIVSLRKLDTDL